MIRWCVATGAVWGLMALAGAQGLPRVVEATFYQGSGGGRTVVIRDPLFDRLMRGEPLGEGRAIPVRADGTFDVNGLPGGILRVTVENPVAQTVVMRTPGAGWVRVNGELRGGDVYGTGAFPLPVRLGAGRVTLDVATGRGIPQIRFEETAGVPFLELSDATTPDYVSGRMGETALTGLTLVNPGAETLSGVRVMVREAGSGVRRTFAVAESVPGMRARKVGVPVLPTGGEQVLSVIVDGEVVSTTRLTLRTRQKKDAYKVTFRSAVDGSVQYYALREATGEMKGLILSLHGASVEASGQADAYASLPDFAIVAATNRRPFGFDWEDIGRTDGLEVLADARRRFGEFRGKTFVTGHSMGGHGTWHFASLFPDTFAAYAPNAGWMDFGSYVRAWPEDTSTPLGSMLRRARIASEPRELLENLLARPVTGAHGDADETVPIAEMRTMRDLLAAHPDATWHEEKGGGHWYDDPATPGAESLTFPGIFEMFRRAERKPDSAVRQVRFATPDPGISSAMQGYRVLAVERVGVVARISADADWSAGRVTLATTNVRRLGLPERDGGWTATVDGASVRVPAGQWLEREAGVWRVRSGAVAPVRARGMKGIFGLNGLVFVYGTVGTAAETAWSRQRALYDLETYWIRGNGSVDVMSDAEYLARPRDGRTVISYGHAEMNRVSARMLAEAGQTVVRGRAEVMGQAFRGEDLAVWLTMPGAQPGAVLAATGADGLGALDRVGLWNAGVGFPEGLVVRRAMLLEGVPGVELAGFWGWDYGRDADVWVKR